jgi:hypothetical protein
MSLLDFFYLRDAVLPAERSAPTAKNTVLALEGRMDDAAGALRFALGKRDLDALAASLAKLGGEPVAYLGALPSPPYLTPEGLGYPCSSPSGARWRKPMCCKACGFPWHSISILYFDVKSWRC